MIKSYLTIALRTLIRQKGYTAINIIGLAIGMASCILITCLGLFALASFMTEQRTKEIGIRKILGASIPNILVLLSRDFTILVLVAFIIAAPVAYYLMDQWWLQSFAYRLDLGMGPFALAGIISLLIAWLTVGYHAAKIARMNPVETLKYE